MTTGKVAPGEAPGILSAWGPAFARDAGLARSTYSSAHPAAAPWGAEEGRPRQSQRSGQLNILQTVVLTDHFTQRFRACITIYGQASRLISIGKLNVSPRLHTRPITWSSSRSLQGSCDPGRSHLVEGFTLRCIQRFSLPDVATRRCRWRDNRYTRGPSNPVLSY
jgi:hypothetical protein